MRVVIDTNILVSFAIRPNPTFEALFDHITLHGKALVSDATITELCDVLSREKFRKYIPFDQSIDYIEWYLKLSERVDVTEQVLACRDPRDDKFLSLAVSGKADYIIAGDHDLVDMQEFAGIQIYSPAVFRRLFISLLQ